MSWPAVLVVAAAVVVIAACGYLLSTWPPEPPPAPDSVAREKSPASDERSQDAEPAAAEVSQEPLVMTVLGDSFTARSPASAGPEWPKLLGNSLDWRVFANAADASGYVNPGAGKPFGARVQSLQRRDPDVVVIAGGAGDLGGYPMPQVVGGASAVITRVVESFPKAQVVLVSPFSFGEPGPLTLELSAELQRIARQNDVEYVDATRWLGTGGDVMSADGIHPTELGQQRLAQRMEQALLELGLAKDAGTSSAASSSSP